jgi:hypothetical protein
MKRFLLWSFGRGSYQYDIICALIIAFIALTPPSIFNDRPDYMKIDRNQLVRQTTDDNGNKVFTVQIETPAFSAHDVTESAAVDSLTKSLGTPVKVSKIVPVHDTMGGLIAYSIWLER